MGLLDIVDDIFNDLCRLLISIIVVFLYCYLVFVFSTDGSSNVFLYLFYSVILSIPFCVSRMLVKNNVKRTVIGVSLAFYTVIVWTYYVQLISIHLGFWLFITSSLLFAKARLSGDEEETSVLLPSVLLTVCVVIFLYGYSGKNFYFKSHELDCATSINMKDVVGLTQDSMKMIDKKDTVIVNSKACPTGNGNYEIVIAPLKNKFFAKQYFRLNSDVQTFNELLSEIKYVSNFYNSYLASYGFGLSSGLFKAFAEMFKAVFQTVIHPIDTLLGIYNMVKSIPSWFVKVKSEPLIIITEPINDAKQYLDDIEKEIAKKNNIDLNRILLVETTKALKHERNVLVCGEKGADVAMAITPFIGGIGKTATVAKAAIAMRATKALTTVTSKATKLVKIAKVENKLPSKTAQRASRASDNKKIEAVEGKQTFYPKARSELENNGYSYSDNIKGKGKQHARKPDFMAEDKNEIVCGEIKSANELKGTSSWRNSPANDAFPAVRKEIRKRAEKIDDKIGELRNESRAIEEKLKTLHDKTQKEELLKRKENIKQEIANLKNEKRIGDHEIIIRGQIPDYVKTIRKNYDLPDGMTMEGKVIKGAYTVPPSEAANVEAALKRLDKSFKRLPPDSNTVSDTVTFIFDP